MLLKEQIHIMFIIMMVPLVGTVSVMVLRHGKLVQKIVKLQVLAYKPVV